MSPDTCDCTTCMLRVANERLRARILKLEDVRGIAEALLPGGPLDGQQRPLFEKLAAAVFALGLIACLAGCHSREEQLTCASKYQQILRSGHVLMLDGHRAWSMAEPLDVELKGTFGWRPASPREAEAMCLAGEGI